MLLNKETESTPSCFPIKGIGKQIAKYLARLEIYSVEDLLLHLPIRYQNRTQVQAIRNLVPSQEAVVEGVIQSISTPKKGKTKILVELKDETGIIRLRFFHVFSYQREIFKVGVRIRCYSEVRWGSSGLEMFHPDYQVINPEKPILSEQHLTPIYPATEGLSQNLLRKLTANALNWLENEKAFPELVPPAILQAFSFPTLKEALKFVHRPAHDIAIEELMERKTLAQKRLVFEELLAHRLCLLQMKYAHQGQKALLLNKYETLSQAFIDKLPFQLTGSQQRVMHEVRADLMRSFPMLRLIQGDVGSGKTVIAALAMLQTVESGYQVAMMAPTELLAEQHYRVIKKWVEPLNLRVVFLSSKIKSQARQIIYEKINSGEAEIIIGTHALFQKDVNFSKIALIIIDEQHRFGVHQRAMLVEKGKQTGVYPHQLIMTATPIPRTLAMSFYADIDSSIIDELPPGRTPVSTSVIADNRRDEVISRISKACQEGRQVYWVCPLINESEVITCQAATKAAEHLKKSLGHLNIGLIHGRMSSEEKEVVMTAFQAGEIHLLVATTVIEVGVDVPNASVMIIENAERLGLSQLHQLRGRVGRGDVASHCILLYQQSLSALAKTRLGVMRDTTDGFKIAQRDLELRGPGEVLGTRQTGELTFCVADLMRDKDVLPAVHQAAERILHDYPTQIEPLVKRWIGIGNEYGKV